MIGSLAYAGAQLGESSYTKAAERAARFVLKNMRTDGRLLRTYRDGEAKLPGYLDDYVFFIDGLLELHETTRHKSWLEEAKQLAEMFIAKFHDVEDGGFYFTSDEHEHMLTRLRDPLDKAMPSGNGVAARVLVRLAQLTGERRYLDLAKSCFDAFQPIMERAPRGTESLLLALAMYFDSLPAEAPVKTGAEEPEASAHKKPVHADVYLSQSAAAPGGTLRVAVKLTIDKGWHVNSHKPFQEYLIPTSLQLHDSPSLSLGEVAYPIGRQTTLGFEKEPVSVYEGTAWIIAPVKIARTAKAGERQLDLRMQMQPCSEDNCLPPQEIAFAVPFEVSPKGGEKRHQAIFKSIAAEGKKPRKRK
jgi:hypothetical protein